MSDDKKIEENKDINDNGEKENYVFLREQIKSRPINKNRILKNGVFTIISAVVFGLIACITFVLLSPVFEKYVEKDKEESTEIVFFPDEIVEEEMNPEDMLTDEQIQEVSDEDKTGFLEEQEVMNILSNVTFSLEDYEELYSELSTVAKEAEKSIVRVAPVSNGVDIFSDAYNGSSELSGLIVAEKVDTYYIISKNRKLDSARTIVIVFSNNTQVEASLVGVDKNTGFAILGVEKAKVNDDTKSVIKVANLGSSLGKKLVGTPIIAIGSPMGDYGSVNYGMVSSATSSLYVKDATYKKLVTDIYGSTIASGVLINLEGEVVGLISMDINDSDFKNLVSAVGISEMKKTIELLINKKQVVYLGITGTDVPKDVANVYSAPEGAFVMSVIMNSPAMEGGIQRGDIITSVNGVSVTSMKEYTNAVRGIENEGIVKVQVSRLLKDTYTPMDLEINVRLGE